MNLLIILIKKEYIHCCLYFYHVWIFIFLQKQTTQTKEFLKNQQNSNIKFHLKKMHLQEVQNNNNGIMSTYQELIILSENNSSVSNQIINDKGQKNHNNPILNQNQYIRKMQLKEVWLTLNSNLQLNSYAKLGNMFVNDLDEIQKTLNAVKNLVYIRQKDKESYNELSKQIRNIQNEKYYLTKKCDMLQKEKNEERQNRNILLIDIKLKQKQTKQAYSKLLNQKEEISKQLTKTQNKQLQYLNDFRKKELIARNCQQITTKIHNKTIVFKNSFEINNGNLSNIQQQDNDFLKYIEKNYENRLKQIEQENYYLKEFLTVFIKELNELIVHYHQLVIPNKNSTNHNNNNNSQSSQLKIELFKVPKTNFDNLKKFEEQLIKFKSLMKNLDTLVREHHQTESNMKSKQNINDMDHARKIINQLFILLGSQDLSIKNILMLVNGDKKFMSELDMTYELENYKTNDEDQGYQKLKQKIEKQNTYLDSKQNLIKRLGDKLKEKVTEIAKVKDQFQKSRDLAFSTGTLLNANIRKMKTMQGDQQKNEIAVMQLQ